MLTTLMTFAVHGAETSGATQPRLQFNKKHSQATLGRAYRAAIRNLMVINTVPIKNGSHAATYNQTGLIATPPGTFVRAGGGYDQPWTRDASVNSWNAANLLEPAVARNTLWAVVKRQKNGRLIVQQDKQWWDQIIWVTAAWKYYTVTGNRTFLRRTYETAVDTLKRDREEHFNEHYGLFEGPAFLNDGIAGYPSPPADATDSSGSFVLEYPGADRIMVLSTNCLYVSAYQSAAKMAQALGRPAEEVEALEEQANTLAAIIRKRFWIASKGRFGYLIQGTGSQAGKLETYQEGSGQAFAILFHVATPEQAWSVLSHVKLLPHGIPDVYPSFPRYEQHPGRHNVIVWPIVEGFWADAAAREGDVAAFGRSMSNLAGLAVGTHDNFYEIYNGTTGRPDGGWQTGQEWKSQPNQTWSATAYLRMIFVDLFGMRFRPDGIAFRPVLPKGWGTVSLSGVHYRDAKLTIRLLGSGAKVESFRLDGKKLIQPMIPATLHGRHVVEIQLVQPNSARRRFISKLPLFARHHRY
jgi:glycogen debranching enzyme